jgi:hypothetical protein
MGINLDQARAARREKLEINPTVTFGGAEFEMPIELPLSAVSNLRKLALATQVNDGDAIEAALLGTAESLLGPEQYAKFLAFTPSIGDLAAFIEGIPGEYGLDLGEAPASAKPSKSGGARPRPRSAKPTASTSES